MGPEGSTFDGAGGTQGSFGGLEQRSDMTKAGYWRDGTIQGARRAEERLSGLNSVAGIPVG